MDLYLLGNKDSKKLYTTCKRCGLLMVDDGTKYCLECHEEFRHNDGIGMED